MILRRAAACPGPAKTGSRALPVLAETFLFSSFLKAIILIGKLLRRGWKPRPFKATARPGLLTQELI